MIKLVLKKVLHFCRRCCLKYKHFTLISNNCWGGITYQKFGMKYESPTIGLVIPPDDYNKFINNLNLYLSCDVEKLNIKDARHQELFNLLDAKHGDLVYGKIKDIEICFLHYKTFDIAKDKWDRRIKRMSKDHIIFKNNDNNLMTEEDYRIWNEFAKTHKSIFFSCNKKWINESKAKVSIYSEEMVPDCQNWVADTTVERNPAKLINKLLK